MLHLGSVWHHASGCFDWDFPLESLVGRCSLGFPVQTSSLASIVDIFRFASFVQYYSTGIAVCQFVLRSRRWGSQESNTGGTSQLALGNRLRRVTVPKANNPAQVKPVIELLVDCKGALLKPKTCLDFVLALFP